MNIEELETPAVVVDLDILEANLVRVADYARGHGLLLRPHTKTHKIPAIARMQIASGCHGLTVAKSTEAEVMAGAGLDNILVAYPILVPEKARRLASLAVSTRILVAIDSLLAAQVLSEAAQAAGSSIGLLVELDVGMRRCGLGSPEEALTLTQKIVALPHVSFEGLNFYPGQIHVAPAEQERPLLEVEKKVRAVVDLLAANGLQCKIVSGGSTPTLYQSHLVPSMTEIRPGTYVFNDRNTVEMKACSLKDCALRVLVTVVSDAVEGRAMVDGGSKTFSGDHLAVSSGKGFGYVVDDPAIYFEAMSEEHGHLDISKAHARPRVGQRLSIIPNHVCACVNMHDRIWRHRKGVVEGCWEVAGRGKLL